MRPTTFRKDRWIVGSVLLLGFILTAFMIYGTAQKIANQDQQIFLNESHHLVDVLSQELRAVDESLYNIAAFFAVSPSEVDSDSFRLIAETTLSQQQSVRYISFARWVPASEKQEFEVLNWRSSGVAEFRIHGFSSLPEKSELHLPIVFIEPLTPKSITVLGLDLWSDAKLKTKIMETIESGQTVVSENSLIPNVKGFGLWKAVYSGKILPTEPDLRKKAVFGVLRAFIGSQELVESLKGHESLFLKVTTMDRHVIAVKGEKPQKSSFLDVIMAKQVELKIANVNYQLQIEKIIPFTSARVGIYLMVFLLGASVSVLIAYRINNFLKAQREILERQNEVERKVTEKTKALQQSEELLRQVINSNPNVIFAQTADYQILFANEKFFQIFQKTPEEIYGVTINFDLPGQKGTALSSSEEQIQLSDGTLKWFETTRITIELENHGPCYLIVGVDISQKKVDEALIAEQRAKMFSSAKLSALGEMAGGVAHEINSPLTTILLLSEQITKILKTSEPNLKVIGHHSQVITRTTGRIAKIVSGLRTFSQDGSQDRILNFNLIETIEETLSLCREKFQNSGVKLECEFHGSVQIVGREVQISQALLNLLNNSFDAVQGVELPWIRIGVVESEARVWISVEDNGSGVSGSVKDKIFQPFFSTKEIGKGTGLGLSISKGIVESHKGRLICDEHSKFTKFVIELPKAPGVSLETANHLLS